MATYWISQPKKHCDFCHCWIADNRASVDFHERGKRHQENVEKKLKELRKKGQEQYQMQKTLDDDLIKMETEALKAFKKDLANDPALAAEYKAKAAAAAAGAAAAAKQKEERLNAARKLHKQGMASTKPTATPAPGMAATSTAGAAPTSAKADQPSPIVDAATDKADSSAESSTQCAWLEGTSPEGHTYYWNTATGESLWEKPDGYEATAESTMYKVQPQAEEDDKEQEQQTSKGSPRLEPPGTEDEEPEGDGEEQSDGSEEEEDEEEADEEDTKGAQRPAKHKLTNPYGGWSTIVPDNTPPVDLELPELDRPQFQLIIPQAAQLQPREKVQFKERTVSSLSTRPSSASPSPAASGQASFKKRKFGGGARSIRQRDADT